MKKEEEEEEERRNCHRIRVGVGREGGGVVLFNIRGSKRLIREANKVRNKVDVETERETDRQRETEWYMYIEGLYIMYIHDDRRVCEDNWIKVNRHTRKEGEGGRRRNEVRGWEGRGRGKCFHLLSMVHRRFLSYRISMGTFSTPGSRILSSISYQLCLYISFVSIYWFSFRLLHLRHPLLRLRLHHVVDAVVAVLLLLLLLLFLLSLVHLFFCCFFWFFFNNLIYVFLSLNLSSKGWFSLPIVAMVEIPATDADKRRISNWSCIVCFFL